MTAQAPGMPISRAEWGQLRAHVTRLVARRLANRFDVEDIVQDVLLRVARHAGHVRDRDRFGAWLMAVVRTATADHLRARPRPIAERELEPVDEAPGTNQAQTLLAAVLRPFIGTLSAPYREALALSELEGLPHAAIAQRLGLSISAVKSRVQRGRQQLRARLEACCEIVLDARGAPSSCTRRPNGLAPPSEVTVCTSC